MPAGDGHSRQRTLEATIDWSYGLLAPDEQVLFRACSVFYDAFDLEDACGVADIEPRDGADLVASLAARSLLVVAHTDMGARYRLLETLRAYGEQKLVDHDETRTVRCRLIDHVAYRYVPPDDRILHDYRWGDIEANHQTVTTAVDHAADFDLPPETRVRLLTASLMRPTYFETRDSRNRASLELPDDTDPDSPLTLFATVIIGIRGRMFCGDLDGALECFRTLERAPEPWPWLAIANRLRIEHRHDPDTLLRTMPAPTAPREHGVPDRARISFHTQATGALGGLDRDAGLAHLDQLDQNPLVVHAADQKRFAFLRYAIESAWAGPHNLNPYEGQRGFLAWANDFTPYQDDGDATTRVLAERYRTIRRDPANVTYATSSLILLAMAAEAREHHDLMRRALLTVGWRIGGVIDSAIVPPVIARRHGFLDELVSRDLDESETRNLGEVFLELAPRLDPAITTDH